MIGITQDLISEVELTRGCCCIALGIVAADTAIDATHR